MKKTTERSRLDGATRTAALCICLVAGAISAGAAERGPRVKGTSPSTIATASASQAHVIVKFKSDSGLMRALSVNGNGGPQNAQALSLRMGLSLADGHPMGPRTQVLHGAGLSSQQLADQLNAQSDVEYAVVVGRMHALAVTPNDPLYLNVPPTQTPTSGQWYLQAPNALTPASINAEAAWSVTTGKSSIVVADLDTGVRFEHPDLTTKLLPGYDFVSDPNYSNDGDGRDADASDPGDAVSSSDATALGCPSSDIGPSSWHGTQTAGLIGAATNNGIGMASIGHDVMVMPVRVLGKCGGTDPDIIDAMRWAGGLSVPNVPTNSTPARVLNMSLGSTGTCSAAYQDAIDELTAANVVVVVAVGNDGTAVGTPANCKGVIAVAGVRQTGTKVGYSDLGPQVTLSAPAGNCVNEAGICLYPILTTSNTGTAGPLASTYTTGGDDASLGTSFSTPLVTGTVALMLSTNAALTPNQVIATLKKSARPFPSTGADTVVTACTAPSSVPQSAECYCTTSVCGAGLLDAGLALAAVSSTAGATANINVASTSVVVGTAVTLDGSGSSTGPGNTITAYQWAIATGGGIASITSSSTASTVTVLPSATGTVVVGLTVTDSAGHTDTTSTTLSVTSAVTIVNVPVTPVTTTPAISSSGGGGAMSTGWLLAWLGALIAVSMATPRKRDE
jgi:serine protease